jgi:hypothetical protein
MVEGAQIRPSPAGLTYEPSGSALTIGQSVKGILNYFMFA